MKFALADVILILERMPSVLEMLLKDLPDGWIYNNEGGESWNPYHVIGHLIHGEKTDWIPRVKIILSDNKEKTFEPFDRFAMMKRDPSIPLRQLLDEFKSLRMKNLEVLRSIGIKETDLDKKGMHPVLGEVTLTNLLATWAMHDLTHLAQITRVLAFQYKEAVGPWTAFLGVYQSKNKNV